MNFEKLTSMARIGTLGGQTGGRPRVEGCWMRKRAILLLAGAAALSGCININAPEDRIVIQLDINIRAEVLYRLAEDANNTIDENDGLF